MSVAVIIPAFNEERGIAGVIESIINAELPDEIIVVSDGSTDKTVEIAKSFNSIKVIDKQTNQGKASAMKAGVNSTNADIIVFVDADLVGLKPKYVDALIKPISENRVDITMGLFSEGRFSTDWAQKMFPFLTGQRGMRRQTWEDANIDHDIGYGVEMMLTKYIAAKNLKVQNVLLKGCTQHLKEEKVKGKAMNGFSRRMKMAFEVVKLMFTPIPSKYKGKKKKVTG